MQKNGKYGVLLLGGHRTHQENYAQSFANDRRCQLVAFADEPDAPEERIKLARSLAEELNLPFIPDLDEALARDDVHIVSLCTEVERRGRVGTKCAEAGKHVYLDKPMALNPEDTNKIVDAVTKSGVRTQMFSNIYSTWARTVKQGLDSGHIGKLKAIHCDVMFAKGHPGTAPVGKKRIQKPNLERYSFVEAKPEMFDIGVYAVSMVNWLTQKRVKNVFGGTANYFFKEHHGCDLEDFGALVLTLEGDVTATIAAGRYGWQSHAQGGIRKVHLVGTDATLTFDASSNRLEVFTAEPTFEPPTPHPLDPMGMWSSTQAEIKMQPKQHWIDVGSGNDGQNEFGAFIDCIENGVESEMNAEFAAHSVEVICAGYRSAASGEVIKFG
ncbi:MAG: Gfo/Idh/MocA family oxidoreductase [Candidatus Poribacteria bacterium]|nr:Gfo/Idh/MocA family oxidoreductase [Candidatus Poribacteria bacterium]